MKYLLLLLMCFLNSCQGQSFKNPFIKVYSKFCVENVSYISVYKSGLVIQRDVNDEIVKCEER